MAWAKDRAPLQHGESHEAPNPDSWLGRKTALRSNIAARSAPKDACRHFIHASCTKCDAAAEGYVGTYRQAQADAQGLFTIGDAMKFTHRARSAMRRPRLRSHV